MRSGPARSMTEASPRHDRAKTLVRARTVGASVAGCRTGGSRAARLSAGKPRLAFAYRTLTRRRFPCRAHELVARAAGVEPDRAPTPSASARGRLFRGGSGRGGSGLLLHFGGQSGNLRGFRGGALLLGVELP